MANNLLRSVALVGAVAFIPATTASLAQVDVNSYREIDQFVSVLERVKSEYVDQVDDATLIRGAIDGMLNSLDPHSSYLDESGFRTLMTTTEGNYGGLGLTVTLEDGAVKVIAAQRGTPADRAGVKTGDFITHIDGQLFYGGTLDERSTDARLARTNVRLTASVGSERVASASPRAHRHPAVTSRCRPGWHLTVTPSPQPRATQRAIATRRPRRPPLVYIL